MRWGIVAGLLLYGSVLLAAEPAQDYEALLRDVVSSGGVDYTTLKKKRATLDRYVASLAAASPGESRADQIAFWINAYNALTLQQVLDTKPDKGDFSVRHSVEDFWSGRKWNVAGRALTLDGIEHGILRKKFTEPRVHFALVCASRSCPPLIPQLYRGKTLDAVLTRQARAYLADKEQNTFDVTRRRAEVSALFRWYRSDFEKGRKAGAATALQRFLADYAPSKPLAESLRKSRWSIRFKDYDWGLNEAGKRHDARGGRVNPLWLVAYLLATVGLLLYGFHAFKILRWHRRRGKAYRIELEQARAVSALGRTRFPQVLVQVPVFNEPRVVERVIDAVAALDYPCDALEIQVLDDSTDETVEHVDRAVQRWRGHGVPIRVLRRNHRTGFKAGALAAGLARSDAEFVAIFDADFVPPRDFLRRALPLFDMPGRVACVQGRWEHLNRDQNWLTRAQAVAVDAHFFIQQFARAARGAFLNFNGTAGMWRRAAIDAAGGWRGTTLTEDLDLSYRAQLKGWRIAFDPDLAVRAELPPTLGAFKTQQRRWACGSIQCARMFLGPVWRSRLPWWVKVEATAHLCGYVVCVAMMALILLLPFGVGHFPVLARHPELWPLWLAIWIAALGPVTCAVAGQRMRGRVAWSSILSCFLLGLGSCANNALAVGRGLVRPIATFVRTPKQGSAAAPLQTPAPVLEQVMVVVTLASAVVLAQTQPWAVATYALFCSAGFCCLAVYWWVAERRGKEA